MNRIFVASVLAILAITTTFAKAERDGEKNKAIVRKVFTDILSQGKIEEAGEIYARLPGLQHLKQRLLNEPIRHRGDAELALASIQLRDRYPTHQLQPVRARKQLFPDFEPRAAQPFGGLVEVQPVRLRPC